MSRIPGFGSLGGAPNFAEFARNNSNNNNPPTSSSATSSRRNSLANNNNNHNHQPPTSSNLSTISGGVGGNNNDPLNTTPPPNSHIGIPGLSNNNTHHATSAGRVSTSLSNASLVHHDHSQTTQNQQNAIGSNDIMRAQAWAVTTKLGPGRSNKVWVVMRPGRLSLYSSPSGHSRLLLDVQYETLRTLFFFSCPGGHAHVDEKAAAFSGSNNSKMGIDHHHHQRSRSGTTGSAPSSRASSAARSDADGGNSSSTNKGLCLHYFGFDLLKAPSASDGRRRRQRFIFATDKHADVEQWKRFLLAVEDSLLPSSTSGNLPPASARFRFFDDSEIGTEARGEHHYQHNHLDDYFDELDDQQHQQQQQSGQNTTTNRSRSGSVAVSRTAGNAAATSQQQQAQIQQLQEELEKAKQTTLSWKETAVNLWTQINDMVIGFSPSEVTTTSVEKLELPSSLTSLLQEAASSSSQQFNLSPMSATMKPTDLPPFHHHHQSSSSASPQVRTSTSSTTTPARESESPVSSEADQVNEESLLSTFKKQQSKLLSRLREMLISTSHEIAPTFFVEAASSVVETLREKSSAMLSLMSEISVANIREKQHEFSLIASDFVKIEESSKHLIEGYSSLSKAKRGMSSPISSSPSSSPLSTRNLAARLDRITREMLEEREVMQQQQQKKKKQQEQNGVEKSPEAKQSQMKTPLKQEQIKEEENDVDEQKTNNNNTDENNNNNPRTTNPVIVVPGFNEILEVVPNILLAVQNLVPTFVYSSMHHYHSHHNHHPDPKIVAGDLSRASLALSSFVNSSPGRKSASPVKQQQQTPSKDQEKEGVSKDKSSPSHQYQAASASILADLESTMNRLLDTQGVLARREEDVARLELQVRTLTSQTLELMKTVSSLEERQNQVKEDASTTPMTPSRTPAEKKPKTQNQALSPMSPSSSSSSAEDSSSSSASPLGHHRSSSNSTSSPSPPRGSALSVGGSSPKNKTGENDNEIANTVRESLEQALTRGFVFDSTTTTSERIRVLLMKLFDYSVSLPRIEDLKVLKEMDVRSKTRISELEEELRSALDSSSKNQGTTTTEDKQIEELKVAVKDQASSPNNMLSSPSPSAAAAVAASSTPKQSTNENTDAEEELAEKIDFIRQSAMSLLQRLHIDVSPSENDVKQLANLLDGVAQATVMKEVTPSKPINNNNIHVTPSKEPATSSPTNSVTASPTRVRFLLQQVASLRRSESAFEEDTSTDDWEQNWSEIVTSFYDSLRTTLEKQIDELNDTNSQLEKRIVQLQELDTQKQKEIEEKEEELENLRGSIRQLELVRSISPESPSSSSPTKTRESVESSTSPHSSGVASASTANATVNTSPTRTETTGSSTTTMQTSSTGTIMSPEPARVLTMTSSSTATTQMSPSAASSRNVVDTSSSPILLSSPSQSPQQQEGQNQNHEQIITSTELEGNRAVSLQIRNLRKKYDQILTLVSQFVTTKDRFERQQEKLASMKERGREATYQDSVDPLVFEEEEIQHLTQQLSRLVEWCYEKPIKLCCATTTDDANEGKNDDNDQDEPSSSTSPSPLQCVMMCVESLNELFDKSSSFVIAPPSSSASSSTQHQQPSTKYILELLKDWTKSNRQVDIHLQQQQQQQSDQENDMATAHASLNEKLARILASVNSTSSFMSLDENEIPSFQKLLAFNNNNNNSNNSNMTSSSASNDVPLDSVETAYSLQRIVNILREITPASSLTSAVQDVRKTVNALRALTLLTKQTGKRCIAESVRYQQQQEEEQDDHHQQEEENSTSADSSILDVSSTESLLKRAISFATELSRARRDLAAILAEKNESDENTDKEKQQQSQENRQLRNDKEVLFEMSKTLLRQLKPAASPLSSPKKDGSGKNVSSDEMARSLDSAVQDLIKKQQEQNREVQEVSKIVKDVENTTSSDDSPSRGTNNSNNIVASCRSLRDQNNKLNQEAKNLKNKIEVLEKEKADVAKNESVAKDESQKNSRDVKLLTDAATRSIKLMRPDHDRQLLGAEDLALSLEATTQNCIDKQRRTDKAMNQLAKELNEASPAEVTSPIKSPSSSSSSSSPDAVVESCKTLISKYKKQQKRMNDLEKENEENSSKTNKKSEELEKKLQESEKNQKQLARDSEALQTAVRSALKQLDNKSDDTSSSASPQELAENLKATSKNMNERLQKSEKTLAQCASALEEDDQQANASSGTNKQQDLSKSFKSAIESKKKLAKELKELKEQSNKQTKTDSDKIKSLQSKDESSTSKIAELESQNKSLQKSLDEISNELPTSSDSKKTKSPSSIKEQIHTLASDSRRYKKIIEDSCEVLKLSKKDENDLPIVCKRISEEKSLLENKLVTKEQDIDDLKSRLGRLRKDEEETAEEAAARKKRALSTEDELRFQLSQERNNHQEELLSIATDKNLLRDAAVTSIHKLQKIIIVSSSEQKENLIEKMKSATTKEIISTLEGSSSRVVDQSYDNASALKRIHNAVNSSSSPTPSSSTPSAIVDSVESLVSNLRRKEEKNQQLQDQLESLKKKFESESAALREEVTSQTQKLLKQQQEQQQASRSPTPDPDVEQKLNEAKSQQKLLEKEKDQEAAQNNSNKMLIDTLQKTNDKLQKQLDSEHELIVENLRTIIALLRSSSDESSNLVLSKSVDGLLVTLESVAQHHNADFIRLKSALKRIAKIVANAEIAQELLMSTLAAKHHPKSKSSSQHHHHHRTASSVSQSSDQQLQQPSVASSSIVSTAFDPTTATPESTVAETEAVLTRLEKALEEERETRTEKQQHEQELLKRMSQLERHVSVVTADRECLVDAMKSIAESIASSSKSKDSKNNTINNSTAANSTSSSSSKFADQLQRILRQIQSHSQSQTRRSSPNPLPPTDDVVDNLSSVSSTDVDDTSSSTDKPQSSTASTAEPSALPLLTTANTHRHNRSNSSHHQHDSSSLLLNNNPQQPQVPSSSVQALANITAEAVAELAEKERTVNETRENVERLIEEQHVPGDVSSMEAAVASLLNELNRTRRLVETGSPDHTRQQIHLLRTADECLRALVDTGKINIPLPPTTNLRDREAPQIVANALRSATEQVLPMIEQYVYQSRPGSRVVSPSRGLSPYNSPGGSPNKSMHGRPPRSGGGGGGPIIENESHSTRRVIAEHEEAKKKLAEELTQSRAENEKLLENVTDLEQQCNKVDSAMLQLQGTLDEIAEDRERSKQEANETLQRNEELTKVLEEANEKLRELESNATESSSLIQQQRSEIKQKNEELEDVQSQLAKINSALERTDSENFTLRQNLEKTNDHLEDTQKNLQQTQGQLGELQTVKTQIDQQIVELAAQREKLTANLKKAEDKIDILEDQKETLETSLEEQIEKTENLDKNLDNANEKIEKLSTNLDSAKNDISEKKKAISQLESNLESSRTECEQLTSKLEKSNIKNDQLNKDLKASQELAAKNEDNANILQKMLNIATNNSFSFSAATLKLSSDSLDEFTSLLSDESTATIVQHKEEINKLTKERDGLIKEKKILSEASRRVISQLDPLHRKFIQRQAKAENEKEQKQQQQQQQKNTTTSSGSSRILDEIEEDEHDEQVQRERAADLEKRFSTATSADLAEMVSETAHNSKALHKQDSDRLQKLEESVDKLATGNLIGSDGSIDSFGTTAEAQIDRLKTSLKVLHERSRAYDEADAELKIMTNQREALVEAARSAIFSLDGNKRRVVAIQHENDGFIVAKALKAAAKDASDVRRAKQAHIDHLRSLLLEVVPQAAVANPDSPVRTPGKQTSIPDPHEQLNVEDDVTPLVDAVVAEVRKQRTQLRTLEQQTRSASIKSEGESHSTRSAILETAATLSSAIGKSPEEVVKEEERATHDTRTALGLLKSSVSATLEQLRKYHRDAALNKQQALQAHSMMNEIRESLAPVILASSDDGGSNNLKNDSSDEEDENNNNNTDDENTKQIRKSGADIQLETSVATLVTELERLRKIESERNRELPLFQRANADRKMLMMTIRDSIPASFKPSSSSTTAEEGAVARQKSTSSNKSRSVSPQVQRQASSNDDVFNVSEASSSATTRPSSTERKQQSRSKSPQQQHHHHSSLQEYTDAKHASHDLLEYINHLQNHFRDKDKSHNIERQLAQNKISNLEQELDTLHRTSQQLLESIRSSSARQPPPFSSANAASRPGSRKSSPNKNRSSSSATNSPSRKNRGRGQMADDDDEQQNQQQQQHHGEDGQQDETGTPIVDNLAAALVEASGTFERENSRKEKNLRTLAQLYSLDPTNRSSSSPGEELMEDGDNDNHSSSNFVDLDTIVLAAKRTAQENKTEKEALTHLLTRAHEAAAILFSNYVEALDVVVSDLPRLANKADEQSSTLETLQANLQTAKYLAGEHVTVEELCAAVVEDLKEARQLNRELEAEAISANKRAQADSAALIAASRAGLAALTQARKLHQQQTEQIRASSPSSASSPHKAGAAASSSSSSPRSPSKIYNDSTASMFEQYDISLLPTALTRSCRDVADDLGTAESALLRIAQTLAEKDELHGSTMRSKNNNNKLKLDPHEIALECESRLGNANSAVGDRDVLLESIRDAVGRLESSAAQSPAGSPLHHHHHRSQFNSSNSQSPSVTPAKRGTAQREDTTTSLSPQTPARSHLSPNNNNNNNSNHHYDTTLVLSQLTRSVNAATEREEIAAAEFAAVIDAAQRVHVSFDSSSAASGAIALADALEEARTLCSASEERAKTLTLLVSSVARALRDLKVDELPDEQELQGKKLPASQETLVLSAASAIEKLVQSEKAMKNILSTMKMQSFGENWEKPVVDRLAELEEQSKTLQALQNNFNNQKSKLCRFAKIPEDEKNWADQVEELIIHERVEADRVKRSTVGKSEAYESISSEKDRVCNALGVDPQSVWFDGIAQKFKDAHQATNDMEQKFNEVSRQRDILLQSIVGGTSRSYVDDATIDQAKKRVMEDHKRLDSSLDTNRAWLDAVGELIRAMNLNHPGEDKLPAQITNPCRIHYTDVAATSENYKREKASLEVALRQVNDSNGNLKEEVTTVSNNLSTVIDGALETYFYTKENAVELSKFVKEEVKRLRSQFGELGMILVKVNKELEDEKEKTEGNAENEKQQQEGELKADTSVSVPQTIHSCHLVVHELREKRALAQNALENVSKFKTAMDSVGEACSITSIALTPAEHSDALVKQIEEWREDVKVHRHDLEAYNQLREEHTQLLDELSRIKELLGHVREASSVTQNASSPSGFNGSVSEHTINGHHQQQGGGHASPAPGSSHQQGGNNNNATSSGSTLQRTGSGIPPPSPTPGNLSSAQLAASTRRRHSKAKLKALDHTESEVVAVTYGDSLRVAESPTRDNTKSKNESSFTSADENDDQQQQNQLKTPPKPVAPPHGTGTGAGGSPTTVKFDKNESQVGALKDVITQLKDTKQTNIEQSTRIDELDLQVSTLRDQLHTVRRENVQLQANLKDRELDIQALESALGEANKRIELLDNALSDRNYNLEQANQILQIAGVALVTAHAPNIHPRHQTLSSQHQEYGRPVSPSPVGTNNVNNNTNNTAETVFSTDENLMSGGGVQQTLYPSPGGRSSVTDSPSLAASYAAQLGPLIPSTVPENIKRVVEALEIERSKNTDASNLIEDSTKVLNDVDIRVEASGGHLELCRLAADTIVGLRRMLEQTQSQLESLNGEMNRERENVTKFSTNAFNFIIQMLKEEFRERNGLIEKYTADPLPVEIAELTRVLQDLTSELPPLAKQEIAGDHERMFLREQLDKAAADRWQDKDAYEDNQQYLAGCLRDIASEAQLELPWSIAEPWPVERFVQVVDMIKEAVRMKSQLADSASGGASSNMTKQELETMRAAVMDICVICGLDPASPSALTVAVETIRLTRANVERMMIAHNTPTNQRKWDLAELGSQCRRLVEISASQNQLLLSACNKLSRLSVGRCTITVPTLDKDSEAPLLREWSNSMETIVVSANPGGMTAFRAAIIDLLIRQAPPDVLGAIGLPANALTPPGGLEGFTDNSLIECISELLGRSLRFAKNANDEIFSLKSKFGAERLAVKERFGPMIRALRMKLDSDRRSSHELRECDVRLGELERHLTTAALTAMTSSTDKKKEVSDMIGHMRNLVRRKIASDSEAEQQFTNVYNNNGVVDDPTLTQHHQQQSRQFQQQNDENNSVNLTLPRW